MDEQERPRAKQYRDNADELRSMADSAKSDDIRGELRKLAFQWDHLAAQIERRRWPTA
jgi:hypothetical protein